MKKIFWIVMIAAPMGAQDLSGDVDRAMAAAKQSIDQLSKSKLDTLQKEMTLTGQEWQQIDRAMATYKSALDQLTKSETLDVWSGTALDQITKGGALGAWPGTAPDQITKSWTLDAIPMNLLAFAPQDDRTREAQDRAREAQDRAREARDRVRETQDRDLELYRGATEAIDEQRYDRAVERLDRVIANKSPRADGAYYWKA